MGGWGLGGDLGRSCRNTPANGCAKKCPVHKKLSGFSASTSGTCIDCESGKHDPTENHRQFCLNTPSPTKAPTATPTKVPTKTPTKVPTPAPTSYPTKAPTATPTKVPTKAPT